MLLYKNTMAQVTYTFKYFSMISTLINPAYIDTFGLILVVLFMEG